MPVVVNDFEVVSDPAPPPAEASPAAEALSDQPIPVQKLDQAMRLLHDRAARLMAD